MGFNLWGVVKNRGLVFLGGSKKKRGIKKKGKEKSHFLLFSPSLLSPHLLVLLFHYLPLLLLYLFPCLIINFKGRRKLQVYLPCVEPTTFRLHVHLDLHYTTQLKLKISLFFLVIIAFWVPDSPRSKLNLCKTCTCALG